MRLVSMALVFLAGVSACKPPPELVARDAELTQRILELEQLIAAEDTYREKREALEAELKRFEIDKAVVKDVAGPTAKVTISGLMVLITLPGTAKDGAALAARLVERQPELRLASLSYDQTTVTLEAMAFETVIVPDPEPALNEVGAPSFCSRRCKDLVVNIGTQQTRLTQLRARAKPLMLITAQERAITGARMMQDTHPSNEDALKLLDTVLDAKWLQPAEKKHELQLLLDGNRAAVQTDVTTVTRADCTAQFKPVAKCLTYEDGGALLVSLNPPRP